MNGAGCSALTRGQARGVGRGSPARALRCWSASRSRAEAFGVAASRPRFGAPWPLLARAFLAPSSWPVFFVGLLRAGLLRPSSPGRVPRARAAARPPPSRSISAGSTPRGTVAFIVPSVTYGPNRPSSTRTGAPVSGCGAELGDRRLLLRAPRRCLGCANSASASLEGDREQLLLGARGCGCRRRRLLEVRAVAPVLRGDLASLGVDADDAGSASSCERLVERHRVGRHRREQRRALRLLLRPSSMLAELHVGPEAAGRATSTGRPVSGSVPSDARAARPCSMSSSGAARPSARRARCRRAPAPSRRRAATYGPLLQTRTTISLPVVVVADAASCSRRPGRSSRGAPRRRARAGPALPFPKQKVCSHFSASPSPRAIASSASSIVAVNS